MRGRHNYRLTGESPVMAWRVLSGVGREFTSMEEVDMKEEKRMECFPWIASFAYQKM